MRRRRRAVADALRQTTKDQTIAGHRVQMHRIHLDGSERGCHLLYASGLDAKRSVQLLEAVKSVPVLTVSDFTAFAPLGGIAHFFVESGKMRFAVNVEAAHRGRTSPLSSKLLNLARL
jgi:hypothetical protein